MQVITLDTPSSQLPLRGRAIALGNFDGVHLGHHRVIQSTLRADARSTVLSFTPHPREFFTGTPRLLLTPLAEKLPLLARMGVDEVVLLPFDGALAGLTAAEFISEILQDRLGATHLSVGYNFRFGKGRQGTTDDLHRVWGDRLTVIPEQILPHSDPPARLSSSRVREALTQGEMAIAEQILGRPYTLTGTVVHGQHLGRTIGVPTANLSLDPHKFLPRSGVYGVQVQHQSQRLRGVMNLGSRPTVTGTDATAQRIHAEVHLLDWHGDLYGQTLTVSLGQFLRPERTFANLSALKDQIEKDCEQAREIFYSGSLLPQSVS